MIPVLPASGVFRSRPVRMKPVQVEDSQVSCNIPADPPFPMSFTLMVSLAPSSSSVSPHHEPLPAAILNPTITSTLVLIDLLALASSHRLHAEPSDAHPSFSLTLLLSLLNPSTPPSPRPQISCQSSPLSSSSLISLSFIFSLHPLVILTFSSVASLRKPSALRPSPAIPLSSALHPSLPPSFPPSLLIRP